MSKLLSSVNLLEGITHLEDLPLNDFIRTVESLKQKIVTEKLDGANLWMGLDENGVFTSREGKSPKKGRFYNVDDYAMVANYNGFRAAHLAIEKVESTIKKVLQEGDMVEIEVLFGRQPNTVTYGVADKNFIVILRGVNGTPEERVNALSDALNNKIVKVESTIVSSPDGDTLELNDEMLTWEFTQVKPMDAKKIDTSEAMTLLAELKKFAKSKNETFPDMSNEKVSELSLTSIPKEKREEAKKAREIVLSKLLNDYKTPIKELLLNKFVRKIKPFLQDANLHPSEDIGVEGVVIRDPVTGNMTKIVDKDVFTAINTFNSAVRAEIAGLVRTTDQDAAVEMRGGTFGQAKIRIAELLGAKELAMSSGTKRFVTKFKQRNAQSTAMAVAASLNVTSLPSARTKISAILKNAIAEVNEILASFKEEADGFKLKLKTGKEIGISPEIMKRTLTAFAETKKDISEVNANVLKSRTTADLVMALYGRTIETLFSGSDTDVKESIEQLDEDTIRTWKNSVIAKHGKDLEFSKHNGGYSGFTTIAQKNKTIVGSFHHKRNIGYVMDKLPSDVKEAFSLIKSISEDGDAGGAPAAGVAVAGSEAQMADPTSYINKTTSANNIASVPFKALKGNKVIMKRIRNFVKPKKFSKPETKIEGKYSMLKAMNEDWAHVDDMKFAADVDDTVSGRNDVEFNQLRNNVNIGDNVTQMDVNQYLDKAHELNDEVDTVTFGMEMDDGSVVKVYVNASQAEEFEAALAGMLGQEDDVEEVIDQLANKFDIVDVEWPKDAEEAETSDDSYVSAENDGEEDTTESDKESDDDIDFSTETPPEDDGEETPADDEESEEPTGDEESEEEPPAEDEESSEGDEESNEDEPSDDEESSEEGDEASEDDEEEEETDDFGQPIKKKKSKKEPTEESMQTYGERFKSKLLGEAAKPKANASKKPVEIDSEEDAEVVAAREKLSQQVDDLLEVFPSKQAKAIVTLMLTLGTPLRAMNLHKAQVRQAIDGAAERYLKNSSFRMWIKKLLGAINAEESSVSEAVGFETKLSNKYQHIIYNILKALGMPEVIEKTAQRQLIAGIRAKSKLAMTNSNVRIYLMAVADELGVDDKVMSMPEPDSAVKEDVITEDVNDALNALNDLFTVLGFEPETNRSIKAQAARQQVKSPLAKLAANPSILAKLAMVTNLIKAKVKTGPAAPQTIPQLASVQFDGDALTEAADQGEWIVGKMGSSGLLLKVKGMTIKMDAGEAEKLSIALSNKKKISVKTPSDKRFMFEPKKKDYVVSEIGDDTKFPEGIILTKAQVEEIIDMVSED